MGRKPMTPEQREKMRSRILNAARERFLEHGLDGLSMRGIAAKVGVSSMTLYLYYDSRQDIVRHIVAEGFGLLNHALEEEAAGDPETRIHRMSQAYSNFARQNPGYYGAMFRYLAATPELCDLVSASSSRPVEYLERAIRECRGPEEAAQRATAMWCALHGLAQLEIAGQVQSTNGDSAIHQLLGQSERAAVA